MKIELLPKKYQQALEIRAAFDRFNSGQATGQDKKIVKMQNQRWAWVARKNAGLNMLSQKQRETKRQMLQQQIALAERQNNMFRKAMLYTEFYNLNG